MKRMTVTITDRYSATGTPRPDSGACRTCDGMGHHPTKCACGGTLPNHTKDNLPGYCFVNPCETCKGTRRVLQ